ncbi:hypothetical protein BHM03_00044899 [Ensete ventricosum]|nr:hypothetical protein BHM03_00044899 [Ensete ventricosum]
MDGRDCMFLERSVPILTRITLIYSSRNARTIISASRSAPANEDGAPPHRPRAHSETATMAAQLIHLRFPPRSLHSLSVPLRCVGRDYKAYTRLAARRLTAKWFPKLRYALEEDCVSCDVENSRGWVSFLASPKLCACILL